MTCEAVRNKLPGLVYGDLAPGEASAIQHHLQGCAACRAEEAALRQVRRFLDAAPATQVSVNLAQLYRQAAEARQRTVRRWRRAAVLLAGAAAVILIFAVLPRLEVRLGDGQLVLRWANPLPVEVAAAPAPTRAEGPAPPSVRHLEEQVQVLNELVQGQREEMAQLLAQLVNLRRQVAAGDQRWLATERDVAALSSSPMFVPKKGDLHD